MLKINVKNTMEKIFIGELLKIAEFYIVDFTVTLQIHLKDVKCNLTIFIDDFWVFIKLG